MSTGGALVFVLDGIEKTITSQGDSDPEILGERMVAWLGRALVDEGRLRRRVAALSPVPDRDPTPAERERYARFRDRAWRGDDGGHIWYTLLRATQGSPELLLDAGVFQDVPGKVRDAHWCSWAYLVDLDGRRFEIYQGSYPARPATVGRWAGQPGRLGPGAPQPGLTYPVQRVATWSFEGLPEPVPNWWGV